MPRVLGQVQAVLVGRSETYTRPGTRSAIAKCPVTGRVSAGPLGLAGDEQADRHVHGGPDKALHLYAFEHYAAWRRELGDWLCRDLGDRHHRIVVDCGSARPFVVVGPRRVGVDGRILTPIRHQLGQRVDSAVPCVDGG